MITQTAVNWFQFTLIVILISRIAIHKFKVKNQKKNQEKNQVFSFYILAILFNDIVTIFWSSASFSFNLFHALGPLAIMIGVYYSYLKVHLPIAIATMIGIATMVLYIDSFAIYISLCFIAVFILIRNSISMLKWKKLDIYKSSFYIILSLDLFASFLELSLGNTPINWSNSIYINYFGYGLTSMFLFTLISLNVFFRRLFIA